MRIQPVVVVPWWLALVLRYPKQFLVLLVMACLFVLVVVSAAKIVLHDENAAIRASVDATVTAYTAGTP